MFCFWMFKIWGQERYQQDVALLPSIEQIVDSGYVLFYFCFVLVEVQYCLPLLTKLNITATKVLTVALLQRATGLFGVSEGHTSHAGRAVRGLILRNDLVTYFSIQKKIKNNFEMWNEFCNFRLDFCSTSMGLSPPSASWYPSKNCLMSSWVAVNGRPRILKTAGGSGHKDAEQALGLMTKPILLQRSTAPLQQYRGSLRGSRIHRQYNLIITTEKTLFLSWFAQNDLIVLCKPWF